MLEAHHFTAAAKRKGSYALPAEFDGTVNQPVLHQAIRAFLNNQRQGTHSTLTRAEVSGGNQKPWRQKGTGRARQGSTRAPHFRGGGIAFGPTPRSYRTEVPRKVRRLARSSALNARAADGAIYVMESFAFEGPKTRQMVELLDGLGLTGRKVCVLTADHRPDVYLSGRNIPRVQVMRYGDASAHDLLWADALVVEEAAVGGHAIAQAARAGATTKEKRAKKVAGKPAGRAAAKNTARSKAAAKKPTKKPAAKPARKSKKGGGDA